MKLYLVGDAQSEKNNDWLAVCMTNEEAERLLRVFLNATTIKEVNIK